MKCFKLFDEFLLQGSSPPQLQSYLNAKKIKFESKKIKTSIHIRSQQHGFQVEYSQQTQNYTHTLSSIFIYLRHQKMNPYSSQYSLPFKISSQMTIKAVFMILGEPTKKGKITVDCQWENLGIQILFAGGSWADQSLLPQYICLFQPQSFQICALCKQNRHDQGLQCSSCQNLIGYCSQKYFIKCIARKLMKIEIYKRLFRQKIESV